MAVYRNIWAWTETQAWSKPCLCKKGKSWPKKYRMWSGKSMTGAMKADLLGINRAANEFGVPGSMLKDRILGKVIHGARSTGHCWGSLVMTNHLFGKGARKLIVKERCYPLTFEPYSSSAAVRSYDSIKLEWSNISTLCYVKHPKQTNRPSNF